MPEPIFGEALDYLKAKVNLPTESWTDIWREQNARGFVVAGANRDALLCDFRAEIEKAIRGKVTLRDFCKSFDDIVSRHGWQYNGAPGWRSRVIYHTNLRQAHMAGRWAQVQRNKARHPYLRYVAVMDARTRDRHRAWHGIILPVDHPWWNTHYPMNGWGCRCTVVPVSEAMLGRYGWTVTDKAPPSRMVEHAIKKDGKAATVYVPEGISPGFDYNPGKASVGRAYAQKNFDAWKDVMKAKKERHWDTLTPGDWQSHGRPKLLPLDKPKAHLGPGATDTAEAVAAIEKVIGGPNKVFSLPDGSSLFVDAELLGDHLLLDRTPYLSFLPEIFEDPQEIWLSFERHKLTGKVELRKRIIKVISLTSKGRSLAVIANAEGGVFVGWTFVPVKRAKDIGKFREGKLVWSRD